IQKQHADRRHFDTAWTLNLVFYAALSVALLLAAPLAAAFYREPRLTAVLQVLAIGFVISGLSNIGIVQFRKELNFRSEFILFVTQKVAGVCVTVPLALALRSYWALVVGSIVSNAIGVMLSYIVHPFR